METMTSIDFKGLSDWQVQQAIDSYVIDRRIRHAEILRKQEAQDAKSKRMKVRNALKRSGFRVLTDKDGWRSNGWSLCRWSDSDGWYEITSSYNDHATDRDLWKLIAGEELEVKTTLRGRGYNVRMTHKVRLVGGN